MDWLWGIEKLAPAALGFVGAWFGSRWGVTKFKKEKHWEIKIKTYETILSNFETIGYWGENEGNEAFLDMRIGGLDEGPEQFHKAMREISRFEWTGEIYLSQEFRELCTEKRLQMQDLYVRTIRDFRTNHQAENGSYYYELADLFMEISKLAYTSMSELNLIATKDLSTDGNNFLQSLTNIIKKMKRKIEIFQRDLQ